jgi:hypothetical protein
MNGLSTSPFRNGGLGERDVNRRIDDPALAISPSINPTCPTCVDQHVHRLLDVLKLPAQGATGASSCGLQLAETPPCSY